MALFYKMLPVSLALKLHQPSTLNQLKNKSWKLQIPLNHAQFRCTCMYTILNYSCQYPSWNLIDHSLQGYKAKQTFKVAVMLRRTDGRDQYHIFINPFLEIISLPCYYIKWYVKYDIIYKKTQRFENKSQLYENLQSPSHDLVVYADCCWNKKEQIMWGTLNLPLLSTHLVSKWIRVID